MTPTPPTLVFTDHELAMLGKTADALSAYMGAAVLAELGHTEQAQWVIFGRALDAQSQAEDDIVHVQIGGPGTQILGQGGGLDTAATTYDCEFLWAIEITADETERFVRLDPQGEVFDTAPELAMLLPFSLAEPLVTDEDDLAAAPEHELDPDDDPKASRH